MANSSDNSNSQAPSLNVFQFDANAIGESINLFRGNLAFPLHLVSLPSRNGLDLRVDLLYQSNVQGEVDTWNMEAPTDIVGLGWNLSYERIVLDSQLSASAIDATYYFISEGQPQRLIPTPAYWTRGTLGAEYQADLQAGPLQSHLLAALQAQGLKVSSHTSLHPGATSTQWLASDDTLESIYNLQVMPDGTLAILAGGQNFELPNFQFWQISFYAPYNKWEIVKNDSSTVIYGGKGESISEQPPHVIQWGIQWVNPLGQSVNGTSWIGPSTQVHNQVRYAQAWNLARVENSVGNYIIFNYGVKEQKIGQGSLTYTQECHLLQAKNDLGWSCVFSYQPMVYDTASLNAPKEYLDPHADPSVGPQADLVAFQSTYNTHYLDHIDVLNDEEKVQLTLQMEYELKNLTENTSSENPLVYGSTYKRYLTSICCVYPDGGARPPIQLDYIWTTDSTQNRGALQKVTYPAGGSTSFNYELISVGADSQDDPGARNFTISNPFGDENDAPRIWYGPDYVVCGWVNQFSGGLKLNIFTWVGRWQQSHADWFTFDENVNVDKLHIATSQDTFLVSIPHAELTDVYLFSRVHLCQADWQIKSEGSIPKSYRYQTTALEIVSGGDFFVVHDADNNLLDRYAWNWMSRDWDITSCGNEDQFYQDGNDVNIYYMTAKNNYYLIHCYDPINVHSKFSLFYRDALLHWQLGSTYETSEILIPIEQGFSYFSFAAAESFVAMAYVTAYPTPGFFNYQLQVLSWDAQCQNLQFVTLPDLSGLGFINVPTALLSSLGPVIVGNSLIGSGPNILRYDGVQWTYHNMGIQYNQVSDPAVYYYWYGYAADAVLKTENTPNGIYSALDSLDIVHPELDWQTQVLTNQSPPQVGNRQTRFYPTLADGYFTLDGDIYARSLSTHWTNVPNCLLTQITSPALDSTTLINQTPYYAAFMTLDDQGNPEGTSIIFFKNGDVLKDAQGNPYVENFPGQQMFRFLDPSHHAQTVVDGKLPALPLGFITYPTSNTLGFTKEITLHRYANYSTQGPLQAFVVNQVITDSGYDLYTRCYAYTQVSAAQDATLSIVRFHQVKVYEGCLSPTDQKNGYTVHYFYNGLPARSVGISQLQAKQEGAPQYSFLEGLPLAQEQYDVDGKWVAVTQNNWSAMTQIATDPTESTLRYIYGGIIQLQSTTSGVDGVETTTSYNYSLSSGAVREISTHYYGSDGALINSLQTTTFAYQIYPAIWQKNLLMPPALTLIQVKRSTDAGWSTQSLQAQTYKVWTSPHNFSYWASDESYLALSADSTAFTWWTDEVAADNTWLRTQQVCKRGQYGEILVSLDAEQTACLTLYDDLSRFVIAQAINTTTLSYDSFEAYQTSPWQWSEAGGSSVIDVDSFTGERCYQITQSGVLAKSVDVEGGGPFLFAGWLKTPPQDPNLILTLGIANPGTGRTLTKVIAPTHGVWTYFQWVVDLSSFTPQTLTTLQLSIQASSLSAFDYVRLDDLFFVPLTSGFTASIYDEGYLRQTASITPNGVCNRSFYDPFYQVVGQGRSHTLGFSTSFLVQQIARLDATHPFPGDHPNLQLTIGALDAEHKGFYDEFKAEALDQYEFMNSSAADWQVQNRRLTLLNAHTSILGAQIQRKDFQSNSLAAYVLVDNVPQNIVTLGDGRYFVKWDDSALCWQLLEQEGGTIRVLDENKTIGFQKEWVLVLFDTRLLFFANGIPLFNYTAADLSAEPHGVLLGLTQPAASFYNLLIAHEISLSLTYTDGLGRMMQSLVMESGDSVILGACIYDALGAQAISIKPSRIVTSTQVPNPFGFYKDYVTNGGATGSVWRNLPMTGPVVDVYHPQDGGYPFSRTVYEPSPLKRPLQKGLPGKDFAISPSDSGGVNPHIVTYQYGVNGGDENFFYPLPAGFYPTITVTDPDGRQVVHYRDGVGHTLGTVFKTNVAQEGGRMVKASQLYDIFGRPIASIPPNYYQNNTPAPGAVLPPEATTCSYNFLGQIIQTQTPDQGISYFVYDKVGRIRFIQDARGQAENYFNYLKYETLGRLVEKGICHDTWEQARLHADDPTWPTENNSWSNRFIYDGDEQTSHMVGNLYQTQVSNLHNNEADVQAQYTYDTLERVCSMSQTLTTSSGVYTDTFHYTYDLSGNLLTSTDSVTGLTLHYNYTPLSQLSKVIGEVAQTQTVLAQYQYQENGMLDQTNLMFNTQKLMRQYQYMPNNWLQSIQDGIIQEDLQYTSGGCDNTGYYNGTIAKQSMQYKQGQVLASNRCFTVDSLNRLQATKVDGSEPTSEQWALDDNGNFKTHQVNTVIHTYATLAHTNQLQSMTSSGGDLNRSFHYNPNGDVDSVQGPSGTLLALTYNPWNALPQSVTTPEHTVTFKYDPGNLRALKTVSDNQQPLSQTRYVWGAADSSSVEMEETGSARDTKRLAVLPGGTLIYHVETQQYYWALDDHLGSARAVLDSQGHVVGQYDYDVYGKVTTLQAPPFGYSYLYTGQYYDQETGLYNYHARFYDPCSARFLMVDPALQGFTPYSYVGNLPMMFTDPSGEIFGIDDFFISLLIVAVIGATIGTGVGLIQYASSKDTKDIWLGTIAGGVGGAVGFGVGTGITCGLAYMGYAGAGTLMGTAAGVVSGAVDGVAGGVIGQLAANAAGGQDLKSGLGSAAWQGALIGGAVGGVSGYKGSFRSGVRRNLDLSHQIKAQADTSEKIELIENQAPSDLHSLSHKSKLWRVIARILRRPGGLHEMQPVEHFALMRAMGETVEDIHTNRTPTADTEFFLGGGWVKHNQAYGHPNFNLVVSRAEGRMDLNRVLRKFAQNGLVRVEDASAPSGYRTGAQALPPALRGVFPPVGRLLRMPFSIGFGTMGRSWF